jgi:hypothetical protein
MTMVWVTWRQHRVPMLVTVAFVVVFGTFLLVHATGTDPTLFSDDDRRYLLENRFGDVGWLLRYAGAVPALVGMFLGAPLLALEYERGTYQLAWTQSMPRRAWLGVKLATLGAVVTATGLVFGLVMYVWQGKFETLRAHTRLGQQELFVVTGIVPAAWWLFAFAVGVAAGAVFRRFLPAAAATLAVFLLVYIGVVVSNARLHYATPVRTERTAAAVPDEEPGLINTSGGAGDWLPPGSQLVAAGWTNHAGVPLSSDEMRACVSTSNYLACMRDKDYRMYADYHPADRYWRFQLTEAGLLLAASVALGAFTWRRIS